MPFLYVAVAFNCTMLPETTVGDFGEIAGDVMAGPMLYFALAVALVWCPEAAPRR